jgi:AcrR family transcriptional regulator
MTHTNVLNGCSMGSVSAEKTRRRLLAAASELFSERGFHATSARDIARRAGVNLAAAHYHYGSKKDLYLEVLEAQFAEIRAQLAAGGANLDRRALRGLSRAALLRLLETRVGVMVGILLGPPPGLHGPLLHREMIDPSEALPVIVDHFIRPLKEDLEAIVAELAPSLDRAELERCVLSIVGQAQFYRLAMPMVLRFQGWKGYSAERVREIARHIVEFSVGGLEHVARRQGRRRRAA